MQESSKKNVLRVISAQDSIEDTEVSGAWLFRFMGSSCCCLLYIHFRGFDTHILSYTDKYAPYTRSMKRLRKSCERRSLKCIQKVLETGVFGSGNKSDSITYPSLPLANLKSSDILGV
jgi:hypothetical protein